MRRHGCGTLVFSSSCAVYGTPERMPLDETHPYGPINPYGSSKLTAETMMADFAGAHGLAYVALRYFNAAGADWRAGIGEDHSPESHLIPLVLDAALGRRIGRLQSRQRRRVLGAPPLPSSATTIRPPTAPASATTSM